MHQTEPAGAPVALVFSGDGRSRFPVCVCVCARVSLSLSLPQTCLVLPPDSSSSAAQRCSCAVRIGLCALPARFSHFAFTPALLSKFLSADLQDDREKEGSARKAGRCLRPEVSGPCVRASGLTRREAKEPGQTFGNANQRYCRGLCVA